MGRGGGRGCDGLMDGAERPGRILPMLGYCTQVRMSVRQEVVLRPVMPFRNFVPTVLSTYPRPQWSPLVVLPHWGTVPIASRTG